MRNRNRPVYAVDINVQALQAQQAWWGSALGGSRMKDKWKDCKGPNPLMMMGLDRS
ncbi:hypothetical protein LP7551_00462 [Roseibium album]|nr:hypothetical protein LP7551_00462 [Roseibium album]